MLEVAQDLQLTGHVGALYLIDPNKKDEPVQKTTGEEAWHSVFRTEIKQFYTEHHSNPTAMIEALKDTAVPDKRQGKIWNGELFNAQEMGKFPEKYEQYKKLADRSVSPYVNAKGVQIANTITALSEKQTNNYQSIQDDFDNVAGDPLCT